VREKRGERERKEDGRERDSSQLAKERNEEERLWKFKKKTRIKRN